MNKLYRNLIYDFKAGLGRNLIYYLLWSILIFFLTFNIIAECNNLNHNNRFGCFDLIIRFFLGVKENNIFDKTEMFQIPFEWLLPHIFIILGFAKYPRQDFDECGYNIWIRTRSKTAWWMSKIIWCFVHVIAIYLIWLFIIIMTTFCLDGDISFKITNYFHLNFQTTGNINIFFIILFMPVIVDFAIGAMTMAVSFIMNPLIGLFTGFLALLTAVFFNSPFLIGKYMMLYSYYPVNGTSGFCIYYGIALCILVILCSFFTGYIAYNNKEK